jgi:XTP/dITP diphosphohydrolase
LPSDRHLWFLTQNRYKYNEARSILASQSIPLRQLNDSKIEIQGTSPEEIAKFALEMALKRHRREILVEDSGLFVEGLNGFPGPYSSYVLGTIGLKGVLSLMKDRNDRRAYFRASIAYGSPHNKSRLFTGKVAGEISREILGETGFGYDPIFIPNGSRKTFGQSTQAFKNTRSHRAKAFLKFAKWFQSQRF